MFVLYISIRISQFFPIPTWRILGVPESEITWHLQVMDSGSCVPAALETAMEILFYRKSFPSQNPSVLVEVEPSVEVT